MYYNIVIYSKKFIVYRGCRSCLSRFREKSSSAYNTRFTGFDVSISVQYPDEPRRFKSAKEPVVQGPRVADPRYRGSRPRTGKREKDCFFFFISFCRGSYHHKYIMYMPHLCSMFTPFLTWKTFSRLFPYIMIRIKWPVGLNELVPRRVPVVKIVAVVRLNCLLTVHYHCKRICGL